MRVGELIEELKDYDPDARVVLKPYNSSYVDGIKGTTTGEIAALHGEDYEAVIIYSHGQVGAWG